MWNQRDQLYYMSYLALLPGSWGCEFSWAMIHSEWDGTDSIVWC